MRQQRKRYERRFRQCKICSCSLEKDNPGDYCPPCKEIMDRLKAEAREDSRRKTPAEDLYERECRIAVHTARVLQELQRQGVKR